MSSITAGRRTQTIAPAMRIAEARPTPNSLTVGSPLRMKLAKTATMIAAAEAMTLPVPARPGDDGLARGLAGVDLLAHAAEEEHLVVHREPEEDREHHHRHVGDDRDRPVEADRGGAVALLEDRGEDAVGGADRQQVHERRLERGDHGAERDQQQQHAQADDDRDDQRQALGRSGRRGRAAGRWSRRRGRRRRSPGCTCVADRRRRGRCVASDARRALGDDVDQRGGAVLGDLRRADGLHALGRREPVVELREPRVVRAVALSEPRSAVTSSGAVGARRRRPSVMRS